MSALKERVHRKLSSRHSSSNSNFELKYIKHLTRLRLPDYLKQHFNEEVYRPEYREELSLDLARTCSTATTNFGGRTTSQISQISHIARGSKTSSINTTVESPFHAQLSAPNAQIHSQHSKTVSKNSIAEGSISTAPERRDSETLDLPVTVPHSSSNSPASAAVANGNVNGSSQVSSASHAVRITSSPPEDPKQEPDNSTEGHNSVKGPLSTDTGTTDRNISSTTDISDRHDEGTEGPELEATCHAESQFNKIKDSHRKAIEDLHDSQLIDSVEIENQCVEI